MKIKKALQLSLNMLVHSRLRSWLTIIGIVIGIASVVAIVSVSQGAQKNLEEQLGQLGADVLTVSPGFSRAAGAGGGFRMSSGGGPGGATTILNQKNLTSKDVLVLKSISNVRYVMGTVSERADVSYIGKSATVSVKGVDPEVWKEITTMELESGRYLVKGDSSAIVVGNRVANSVFEEGMQINRQVTIEGKTFKIVGILAEGGSDDSTIFMPTVMARDVLEDVGEEEFGSILVKIDNVDLTDDTISEINHRLMMSRGILQEKEKDFTVTSPKAFQETITSAISSISLFLAAIAAVSLLVGAVGIANTMFTSVLEKTKEIGIMKAIGAKNRDILLIFLFNSGLLGLVGGIGGVILGVAGAVAIGSLSGASTGRISFSSAYFSPAIIIGAFLLSVIIGMVAGAIPAYRASRLKPVDALRYE